MNFRSKDIKEFIPLNKEEVLKRVSPFLIFDRYLGKYELGKVMNSPFRKDSKPSFSIFEGRGGKIRYLDYASGDGGDCFDFLIKLYNCTFNECLAILNADFNLGLKSSDAIPTSRTFPQVETPRKREALIQVKVQPFTTYDLEYWEKYEITQEDLKRFNIYSVEMFWVNKTYVNKSSLKNPIFAYFFKESKHLKIYSPLSSNKAFKWISNTSREDIQGIENVDYSKKSIILTSSLKDVIVLNKCGWNAIAMSSEGAKPSQFVMEILEKFENIYVLYDNDDPGKLFSENIKSIIPRIQILEIPDLNTKDPSDWVEKYSLDSLKKLFNEII